MFKRGAGSLYPITNFVFLNGGDTFWSSKKPTAAGASYQVKQYEKGVRHVPLEQKKALLFAKVALEAAQMRKDVFMEK
jgi:hypothetical protein